MRCDAYADKRVLEVGCGLGTDLIQFARAGARPVGTDLSDVAIALTRRRFLMEELPTDIIHADAECLPFPDDTFDMVYSFGVLHHTPNTAGAIEEVWRVLRPSGRALIMLYHRHSLNNFVHGVLRLPFEAPAGEEDCPVVSRYSRAEALALFSQFSNATVKTRYLFGTGYGLLADLTPRTVRKTLGSALGWHLIIDASK